MSDRATRVSVLVPCYNHEAYVRQAVDSALAQTRPPDEIVVVDDGSEDGSVAVLRHFGDRIRLIARDNHGIGATYNHLVERSDGDVLAFLESDDALERDYLERCLRFLKEERVAWVSTARRVVDSEGRPTGEIVRKRTPGPRFTTEGFLRKDIGLACTAVVRRDALLEVGPFSSEYRGAMDVEISLRFSTMHPMGYLDLPLYLYRRHAANVSGAALHDSSEILTILRRFQESDWARRHPAAARKGLARFAGRVASLRMKIDPGARREDVLPLLAEARRLDPWSWRHLRRYLSVRLLGAAVVGRLGR